MVAKAWYSMLWYDVTQYPTWRETVESKAAILKRNGVNRWDGLVWLGNGKFSLVVVARSGVWGYEV